MLLNSDMVLSDLEKEHLDLAFHSSGIDQCKNGNIYGPRIRRYHLIHFVLEGSGTLNIDSKKYPVKSKQAFYIPAGCSASYQADLRTPWKYCWIGFHGTQAKKFCDLLFPDSYTIHLSDSPVVYEQKIMNLLSCTDERISLNSTYSQDNFPFSYFSESKTLAQHLRLNGKLKELFADLLTEYSKDYESFDSASYADKIKTYINRHYNEHLQIQHISDALGLHPHYITAVFKKKFNMTPKQYLTELRIEKAKLFLVDTEYTLQVITNAVGLENPFSFSRLFKSVTGISPAEYRKQFAAENCH